VDRKLLDLAKEIKIFKEMNNSIIFTRADKDDIIVDALDGKMYVSKVTEIQRCMKSLRSHKGSCYKFTGNVKWRDANYISNSKYRMLFCNDGILSRTYAKDT